jgi:hypothetical protein
MCVAAVRKYFIDNFAKLEVETRSFWYDYFWY